MLDSMQRDQLHIHRPMHRGGRHVRRSGSRYVEPVQWLLSSAGRGWRWVWSVDHDDTTSTVVAWLAQFVLLASLLFVMVVGAG